MRESQLEKMSLKELNVLHEKIQAAIEEKRVSERQEMRAKMEELARESGFSVSELFGGRRGKGSSRSQVPQSEGPKPNLDRPGTSPKVDS